MRIAPLLAFAAAAGTAACASSSTRSTDTQPTTAQAPAGGGSAHGGAHAGPGMWRGEIRPEGGSKVGGTVMLMPGANGQTTATITLSGAPANGTHPWHVHAGTCAEKGAIVGPPTAYTPLSADASGAARLEAALPFATPTSGSYSVNVHMSASQMGMIVGCADLRTE